MAREFKHGTPEELVLANKKHYYIDFYHVPTRRSIQFKAYLTDFSDKFSSEWNSEDVYGRMDPIVAFKGTKRTISLGWDVPASSLAEAQENMQSCSLLFNMLYPVYSDNNPGAVVSAPPLFRVRFANLIHDGTKPTNAIGSAETSGIVCNVNGFEYSPDMDDGWFEPAEVGVVYPQSIKLSCELTVLHTHSLGWSESSRGDLRHGHGATGHSTFPWGELDGPGIDPVTNKETGKQKKEPKPWDKKSVPATPAQEESLGNSMLGDQD
jgi:hypothetical protein